MIFTEQAVIQRLAPRPVRYFTHVGSTNDVALECLCEGAASGSVVITDEQVKGRGRLGRSWYTPPGTALIVSYVLHPQVEHLPRITMMGAVSICEMIEQVGAQAVGIKWPNDVQLNGLKVSGVLPETVWQGDRLVGVVLGMGVNVRIDFNRTELDGKAISLETALGRSLNRLDLLVYWLERLDHWSAHLDEVYEPWKRRLTTLGQQVSLMNAGETVMGIAESVEPDGALLVRDSDGTVHRMVAGDIRLGSD
jgi:BirA family biotin operon repressor/biotin-[acetyl-CoA-carboxylase] ligase